LLRSNLFLTESAPNQRESDRVVVSGSATMGGSMLAVHDSAVAPGTLIPDLGVTKTWQLISAPASASGTPSSVSLMLMEGGTSATISLAVNGTIVGAGVEVTTLFNANGGFISMTGVGDLPPDVLLQTACGTVTGAEINSLVDQLLLVQQDGTMDAKEVATALLFERPEDLPASYAATQQQNPYATPSVVMDSNFMAGQTAMLRLMQMRDGGMGDAAAKASDASGGQAPTVEASKKDYGAPINGPTPDEGTRAWMRGYGFYEDVDGNPCSDCGYTAAIGSALVGLDWAIDGGGIVGVYGGIGPGQITTDAVNGWQREDLATVTAGIYGSWVPTDSQAYVAGFLNGGYQDINRVRSINIETVGIDRTATSSNDSWSLAVGGELGLNLEAGEATTLQPYVGVGWAQYWGGSYSENGADSLDLQVDSQSANQWQPTLGARLLQEFKIGSDILTPYIGAAFLAQLPVGAGWTTTYTSEFNLDAETQLTTTPQDRYGASFQAGVEFATIKGMTCYIAFDGAVLTDKQRYGGQMGILVPF
jgi:outer membrane autotransporter protein